MEVKFSLFTISYALLTIEVLTAAIATLSLSLVLALSAT
jgi:hypothetical protein